MFVNSLTTATFLETLFTVTEDSVPVLIYKQPTMSK